MTRLFDAEAKKPENTNKAEIRRRAVEADELIAGFDEGDEAGARLRAQLAQESAVTPVVYESYRAPGSKWMIEHSLVGEDYIYQMIPLRPTTYGWKDIVPLMISALDVIFPRSVQIRYSPPNPKAHKNFYTIKVEGVAKLPGWESAAKERGLKNLAAIDAWTAS